MTRIIPLTVIVLSCLGTQPARAQDSLSMHVDVTSDNRVTVYLKNNASDPVTVVTARLHLGYDVLDKEDELVKRAEKFFGPNAPGVWRFSRKPVATLSLVEVHHKGDLVVPSISSLHLVTLRKAEKALIDPALVAPFSAALKEYPGVTKVGDKFTRVLTVKYEVSNFMGSRLGIWSGSIQADAAVLKKQ